MSFVRGKGLFSSVLFTIFSSLAILSDKSSIHRNNISLQQKETFNANFGVGAGYNNAHYAIA